MPAAVTLAVLYGSEQGRCREVARVHVPSVKLVALWEGILHLFPPPLPTQQLGQLLFECQYRALSFEPTFVAPSS
jgi:hypothetical protein